MEIHDDYIRTVDKLWHDLCALLPDEPIDGLVYWSDGTEIQADSQDAADRLADVFDDLYGCNTVVTGWYDAEQDERDGCVDKHTGWYYCSIE